VSDKRSVTTDALETLGTVPIPADSGRDAIHLAVEPVIAGEILLPGQHIGLRDGKAYTSSVEQIGIVDPFVLGNIRIGQKFWLVVYPRQITSLRHVWTHPAFEKEPEPEITQADREHAQRVAERLEGTSIRWMRDFAERIGENYESLMQHAKDHIETGEYWGGGEKFEGESADEEFWKHYGKITGKDIGDQGNFFSCAC
jgi:hypothetical protein